MRWLLTEHYVYGRRTGRIEHVTWALCKPPTDRFDRMSRGHGVEGHAHVNCSICGRLEAARVAIAVLMPFQLHHQDSFGRKDHW